MSLRARRAAAAAAQRRPRLLQALLAAALPAGAVRTDASTIVAAECRDYTDSKSMESCLATGYCVWRPTGSPRCAEKLPENCPGLQKQACLSLPTLCHWEWEKDSWETSCKPGANPNPCAHIPEDQCSGSCMFRQRPKGCVARQSENCQGMNHASCDRQSDICTWRDVPDHWELSCQPLNALDATPTTTTTSSAALQSTWERVHGAFRAAADTACLQRILRDPSPRCREATPVYVGAAVLALLLLCCGCAFCCCCCGGSRRKRPPPGGGLLGRPLRPPEFPPAPGAGLVEVHLPSNVAPGQQFQFEHPRTGKLMMATAPVDGRRVVQVQDA